MPPQIQPQPQLKWKKFKARVIKWADGLLALRPVDRREGEQLFKQLNSRRLVVWIKHGEEVAGPFAGALEGRIGHREAVRIIRALEIEELKRFVGYEVDVYIAPLGEVVNFREVHIGNWSVRIEKLSSGVIDLLVVFKAQRLATPEALKDTIERLLTAPKEEIFKELGL